LEVGEEKSTSAVLVEVKAAPEVDQSGVAMQGPRRLVDDADQCLRGCSDYWLGQEVVRRSIGVTTCFIRTGKRGEGEREERGARQRRGGALLQGGVVEQELGGSSGE
jgi:hypothetical protein